MKRILLSFTVLFALALSSYGQFGPGEEHNPGPLPTCHSDLYISSVGNMPATAMAGSVISFNVTVRNKWECPTSSSNLLVQIEYLPFTYAYLNVTVPPFSYYKDSHTVIVNYQVPSYLAGFTVYLSMLTVDSNMQVSETNENNNRVLGMTSTYIY